MAAGRSHIQQILNRKLIACSYVSLLPQTNLTDGTRTKKELSKERQAERTIEKEKEREEKETEREHKKKERNAEAGAPLTVSEIRFASG